MLSTLCLCRIITGYYLYYHDNLKSISVDPERVMPRVMTNFMIFMPLFISLWSPYATFYAAACHWSIYNKMLVQHLIQQYMTNQSCNRQLQGFNHRNIQIIPLIYKKELFLFIPIILLRIDYLFEYDVYYGKILFADITNETYLHYVSIQLFQHVHLE